MHACALGPSAPSPCAAAACCCCCAQVPKKWHWVESLPRNAMGKVNKKELGKALRDGALATTPVA